MSFEELNVPKNHIYLFKPQLPPYHGHLRVNVKSLWYDEDIFQRFVCGMVATARRELAKKPFYRCPI